MSAEDKRGQPFTEELLSGYLDGALVQQEEQRVRLELEGSAEARQLLEQMRAMREATMETPFQTSDLQFSEKPKGAASAVSRGLGFVLFGVWAAALLLYGLWSLATSDEALFEKLAIFGLVSGAGLLLLSALLDRIRSARTDPYRGVEK